MWPVETINFDIFSQHFVKESQGRRSHNITDLVPLINEVLPRHEGVLDYEFCNNTPHRPEVYIHAVRDPQDNLWRPVVPSYHVRGQGTVRLVV